MISLWSSLKVSHLHLYVQLLLSSEWQLPFTRRYDSCHVEDLSLVCSVTISDGLRGFQHECRLD